MEILRYLGAWVFIAILGFILVAAIGKKLFGWGGAPKS